MALLLISTVQEAGLISLAIKVVWLASFALLVALNAGAAFGVYVAALAVFAVLSSGGGGSGLDRPDNFALLTLLTGLTIRLAIRRHSLGLNLGTLVIVSLVGYGVLQTAWMGLLTRSTFAWYMRMFGLPFFMFLLLAQVHLSVRELTLLLRSLLVMGCYMALVSIAEHFGWYHLIVPRWIVTPSPLFLEASLNFASMTGRAGGLLMQSEMNGLVLSLICCLAIFSATLLRMTSGWLAGTAALLCFVGVFFTYTRAAWLACAAALLVLLWRPSVTRFRTQLKRFGVFAVSGIFILAVALLPSPTARGRVGDSETIFFRLNLWKAAFSMAADRPLFGLGYGAFAEHVGDYQEEMTVGEPMRIRDRPVHNTVLSVLVELGAIGLVLYFGALATMFGRARRAALAHWGREGGLWLAVFVAIYMFQVQFVVAYEPTTNQIFFGMLGAIAGLTGLRSGSERSSFGREWLQRTSA
jgi:O-antigen ligase